MEMLYPTWPKFVVELSLYSKNRLCEAEVGETFLELLPVSNMLTVSR
jgi:hypothetical protein